MAEIKKSRLSSVRLMRDTVRSQVRCRCPNGHAFWAEIFTSLSTGENTDTLDQLVSVGLQHARCTECGMECPVAEPVTINDASKLRFALFVPDMLSHRELELRAQMLDKLMTAGPSDVPPYFSDFQTLVGRTALGLWLTSKKNRGNPVSSGAPLDALSAPDGDSVEPSRDRPPISNKEPPPIHEAFADLEEGDSYVPSYPPDSDMDNTDVDEAEDDWLDDRTFGSGVHMKPPRSDPPPLTGRQAIIDLEDNRIVLIQRARADVIKAFDPKRSALKFQMHRVDDYPLVVLTLVADPADDHAPFLHWFVDVSRHAQKSALEQLQREFMAEVRLYTPDLVEAMRFEIGGPMEQNVAFALKKIAEIPDGILQSGSFDKVKDRFGGIADPLGRGLGSFDLDEMEPAEDFEAAFAHMASLVNWMSPKRFEQLVLVKSYPIHRLDDVVAAVIKEALRFGVHLSDDLKDRARALGMAGDRKEIISKTMSTFDKLLRSGKRPPDEIAAANWHNALKDCDEHGIEPEFGARERAGELLDKMKPPRFKRADTAKKN